MSRLASGRSASSSATRCCSRAPPDLGGELLDAIEVELERVLDRRVVGGPRGASLDPATRRDVREFLIVTHRWVPDLSHWIGCRPAGIHLEVLTLTAMSPSWLKRRSSSLRLRRVSGGVSMPQDSRRRKRSELADHCFTKS